MTTSFHDNMTVQSVTESHDSGAWVFRRLGIDPKDTCTLSEAASNKRLPIELLMAALERTATLTVLGQPSDDGKLQAVLQDVVAVHIERRHHDFLKSELARLGELFTEAIKIHHSSYAGLLGALEKVFLSFKERIEKHLGIEEDILFPQLRNIEQNTAGRGPSTEAHMGSSPVVAMEEMEREHELVKGALTEIRALTSDFALPDDASDVLVMLYEGLALVDADIQEHFRLENDFLWPVHATEQAPEAALATTDQTASGRPDVDLNCPRTNLTCERGTPWACDRFWDCVRQAMAQRWAKMDSPDKA